MISRESWVLEDLASAGRMALACAGLKGAALIPTTNLQSWVLEDLEDLGIASAARMVLAVACPKEAGLITADRYDAGAVLPKTNPATRRGGRKKLATDKQRFYQIGSSVDQMVPRFESAFTFFKQLKVTSGNSDLNTYRMELSKTKLTYDEIDSVLQAHTPRGAAKRFVAKSLRISLSTVNSCYSRYLKASKSKRTLR